MANWFYTENGEQRGPISSADLKGRAEKGLLKPDDHVWQEGMTAWMPAKQIKELFPVVPPPPPPKASPPPPPVQDQSAQFHRQLYRRSKRRFQISDRIRPSKTY